MGLEARGKSVRRAAGLFLAGAGWFVLAAAGFPATSPSAGASVAVAAATTGGTSNWSVLEAEALTAASQYLGDSLYATGALTPVITSTIPADSVTVEQRTLVTADSSTTYVLQISHLNNEQLVVDALDPSTSWAGAVLVLRPDTADIASAYPVSAASVTGASSRRLHAGTSAPVVVDALRHSSLRAPPRLDTIGGCGAAPQLPTVITSIFGRLIQGLGLIQCATPETLAIIVGLYRGLFTHVGTTMGGTVVGSPYLGVNAYAVCHHISGTHTFRTSQLWSVNGSYQGGASSGEAKLHCT